MGRRYSFGSGHLGDDLQGMGDDGGGTEPENQNAGTEHCQFTDEDLL